MQVCLCIQQTLMLAKGDIIWVDHIYVTSTMGIVTLLQLQQGKINGEFTVHTP